MTSSHFKSVFYNVRPDYVYNARCVFLLIQAFKDQVTRCRSIIIDQVEILTVRFDHEGIGGLANLAFERFPEV